MSEKGPIKLKLSTSAVYTETADLILFPGSCYDFVKTIPAQSVDLVVTSPPYNMGKEYEKKSDLQSYYNAQEQIIDESVRILKDRGSICWQTGNFAAHSQIVPLDLLLYPIFQKHPLQLRNRIIWRFGHGLHASKRFSGRYETILWFTKGEGYTFNLDAVRTPQKYPHKKHFKGPKAGSFSCNPLGKNPSDVWDIPNVKNNHVEKTPHPCQFPIALAERLILALTHEGELVFDPFLGAGSTTAAAVKNRRRAMGCEVVEDYYRLALGRTQQAFEGTLKTRPLHKPIYDPQDPKAGLDHTEEEGDQLILFAGKTEPPIWG